MDYGIFSSLSSHDVYPRPQLMRDSFISLNGEWDFATSDGENVERFTEKITVPYPPESPLSGIGRRMENKNLFYKRSFSVPKGFLKDRLILHFGAVDCICDLYINGTHLYKNEGGYLPFSVDITDCLAEENEILLKVKDGTKKLYPYGKQKEKRGGMWYTPVSGIWQTVWLESLPKSPIRNLKITCRQDSATVEVDSDAEDITLTLEGGEPMAVSHGKITVTPKSKRLWSPEDPYLYYFEVNTSEDRVRSYFALRSVGTETVSGKMRFTLNGKPYFFNGLLDQGYFHDGIFTPKTPEEYLKDIRLAKSLGFNMLRKHIKIEPEIFYYLCDREGVAVFQDMVNNGTYSFLFDTVLPTVGFGKAFSDVRNRNKAARKIFLEYALKAQAHLYNHPSICLYTIFNEGWGQFYPDKAYTLLKDSDPTRLYDSTSGWFKGKCSDVDSRHIYFRRVKLKRPDREKPFFLSEFGGYALPLDGHTFGDGKYGYAFMKDKDELYEKIKGLYLGELLPLIKDGLSALVYTQLSDVEDETNGFITYDREVVKIDESKMAEINERLYREFNLYT